MSGNAIGGYFELELPRKINQIYPDAVRMQSGRSAFLALLRKGRPARVWMPHYLCDTMYAPLHEAGVEYVRYSIDPQFRIIDMPELGNDDWIYYVNYFGVRDGYVDVLVERYGPNLVVDNCQAFFSSPKNNIATIFSPRKFFGVPDGGLLLSSLSVDVPADRDTDSQMRSRYLIERLASNPESGYGSYKIAEQSLEQLEPRRMSQLTEVLLSKVEFEDVRKRRNENFSVLHARLAHINQCELDVSKIDGPLCYPLIIDAPGLRDYLIASRVFVATYWADVLDRVEDNATEAMLVKQLFPLPCDQRYGMEDMTRIVDACLAFLKNDRSVAKGGRT